VSLDPYVKIPIFAAKLNQERNKTQKERKLYSLTKSG